MIVAVADQKLFQRPEMFLTGHLLLSENCQLLFYEGERSGGLI